MTLKELGMAVRQHTGDFLCEEIHNERNTKVVKFEHVVTDPVGLEGVPDVGDLRKFYSTFGSILFYHDRRSGDAGRHLAPVSTWSELHGHFSAWLTELDANEREEMLPEWIETALVIGETPYSGNYILVATEGAEAGHVFEFDHDGFEFLHRADSLVEYVEGLLKPDDSKLTDMASYMRFGESGETCQWWILELRDNSGHVAQTIV